MFLPSGKSDEVDLQKPTMRLWWVRAPEAGWLRTY